MIFRISSEDAGQSLLQFLKGKVEEKVSAKLIKRAIEARCCKINGKLELFASHRLKNGDTVEFTLEKRKAEPISSSIKVLYEDSDLFAIDKPAGIVCAQQSLQRLLSIRGSFWMVHRLDKDTTGVLLLAKTQEAKAKLEEFFATRKVDKTYLALVHGWLHEKEKTLSSILIKESSYAGQTMYRSVQQGKGVRAMTRYILVEQTKNSALIQCEPITGRTHQLRVQLAALGSPIMGDTQYGRRQQDPAIQRQMLHAWKISFPHPRTSKILKIVSPLPQDFEQALRHCKLSFAPV